MKKKIVSIVTCLTLCCTFLLSGFISNAQQVEEDGITYNVPYSRPSGDGVGYISLVLRRRSDDVRFLTTFYWSIQPYNTASANYENKMFGLVNVVDSVLTIELNNTSYNNYAVHVLGRYIDGTNYNELLSSGLIYSEQWSTYTMDYSRFGFDVIGYEIGGNCVIGEFKYSNWPNFATPHINWGSDNSADLLSEMLLIMGQNQAMFQTYFPKLNQMNLSLNEIERVLKEMQGQLDISEQEKADKFEEDSGSQSDELGSLNQQTQVDKVDIDSVSQQVDSVLDMETDANYGVLLSTFTSNGRVLTMMLLCVSVALISFVLFGKR